MFLAGCDGLLDVAPVSDITNASYWQREGDVQGYLTGIYSDFRGLLNTTYYGEDRGDAFAPGIEGPVSDAWRQNLNAANAPSWVSFYNLIHHTNLLLKYAQDIPFASEEEKNRVLAETHFIRAYTYNMLVRAWGDVPLVLEPTEGEGQEMPSRAPAGEVMQQILADADRAIELFPDGEYHDKSRASRPAAYALKADALIWKAKVLGGTEEDLQAAVAALDQVIPTVALEENFTEIHATDNRNNGEVIFSLHFERDERSDQYGSRLKPRDIFVETAVNSDELPYAQGGARSVYRPSAEVEAVLEEYPGDERLEASIIKAVSPDGTILGVFGNKMRGTLHPDDRYFDNDIIVYRLGEVLLLKAEALAALGRVPEAVAALNLVRDRAGIGVYTGQMDQQSVEEEILEERFRELYLELERWPDLVRFHSAGIIDVYEVVPNLQGTQVPLYFPIPSDLLDVNPNLQQTKGY